MKPHVIADTLGTAVPGSTDTTGFTAGQDHQSAPRPNQDEPLMENSKLFLPSGTQGDTAHSTTEDMESLTTAEANVPLLDVTPCEDSEKSSADMDICDLEAPANLERYITDLVVECAATDVKHRALAAFEFFVFGLADEERTCLTLLKESPETWRQNGLLKLPEDSNGLVIVATSKEFTEFSHICLAKEQLILETPAHNQTTIAMISQEGAPSLKVSFQITHIPSDETTAETGVHHQRENYTSLESVLARWAHISSPELYMRTRHSEVWNHASSMGFCGTILQRRFEQSGNIEEISNAISAHQRAVQLTPDRNADMPDRLCNLGNSFLYRFERQGDLTDIADASSCHQRAIQLTPNGHADMPMRLGNLGNSCLRRFECTGDLNAIVNAISVYQRVIELTPDGHVNMPALFSNLGASLALRFKRTGDLTDIADSISALQRAVQLTPNDYVDMPGLLNNLGVSLLFRFERTGDLTDIANAISVHQRGVQLTPDGHVSMPASLGSLGSAFSGRFGRTGDLADIANAISCHQRAVQLTPDGHAEMPKRLNNLGNSFVHRSERTGDLTDIADAISAHQRAVQLTPDGHPDMFKWLSNLGNSLIRRIERTDNLTDIADAISTHQRVAKLIPDSDVQKPSVFSSLGCSFALRFKHTGNITDIASAISALQWAVQHTPHDHVEMPGWLNNLGRCFLHRFECTSDFNDIANAISAHQRGVQLIPDGHVNMPIHLANLGNSFLCRFRHTNDLPDILAATSYYRQSATYKSGPPSFRLTIARHWAQLFISHHLTDSLEAHDVVVNLLSQIAGMDRTIQQRHSSLVDISRLTATAASAALAQGEIEKALEWLEQGRCLVWSQLNRLRTPVDNLRTSNHLLADRFLDVSRALESSGSRQEPTSLTFDGTISRKIALEDEARTHVMLAQDWEQLLEEIRAIATFDDFLRPRTASNIMKHLPRDGPVVLINVHENRCDALALIPDCRQPLHIPLDNLTHQYASVLRDHLRSCLLSHGRRMRTADLDLDRATRPAPKPNAENGSDIQKVLQELWRTVVKPILDALSYPVHPSVLPRIWWCSTGPLASLPLHAAGIYGPGAQAPGSCISDYVVSSYTPTVSALLEKVKISPTRRSSPSKVLLVSQPYTKGLPRIPGTIREIDAVCKKIGSGGCEYLHLDGPLATVGRVNEAMASHGWVHLACHASQDTDEPLKSGFSLDDGPLELSKIMKQNLLHCELAFLSACQTSTGDEKLSEEAVHLAAGMLAAGYQGVVATMWSIQDRYAPEVAESFYEYLVKKGGGTGNAGLDSASAAYALHHAVQCIRKEIGDKEDALLTWVPYVHFGF